MNLFRSKEYYIEEVYPKLSLKNEKWVLTGLTALSLSNATANELYMPIVFCDSDKTYKISGIVWYIGIGKGNIDYENYVEPYKLSPNILIPTPERAIIECIKYNDRVIDTGTLLEVILGYIESPYSDINLLYKVADFFSLDRKELDKWIQEAEESLEEI